MILALLMYLFPSLLPEPPRSQPPTILWAFVVELKVEDEKEQSEWRQLNRQLRDIKARIAVLRRYEILRKYVELNP